VAALNPAISPTQSDNYTTRSQGQTPNKAFQYLFGGVADAVSTFKASQKDQAAANKAQDELNFGNDLGSATDDIATGDLSTPARHVGGAGSAPVNFEAANEINGTVSHLRRLKDGVNQGTVTNIYFDTQRMAKVKDLMVKYPQYSQSYIEKELDVALGHSAAVQYRKDLAQAQDEQNKFASDEDKRVATLKAKWAEDGYFANEEVRTHYKQLTGAELNPVGDINEDAMNIAISSEVNIGKQIDRHMSELNMIKADKEAQSTRAEEYATVDMQSATQKMFYTAMNADKARIQYLMRRGKDISPQEIQELTAKMGEMEGQLNIAAEGIVSKYAQYIRDPRKREDIKSLMLGPFTTMKQLVEDKNFGALNAVSNYTSALKNRKDLEFVLKNGDFVANLELATKKYGSEAIYKFFDPSQNLGVATMNEGQKALFDKISLDIYGGNVPVADVLNQLKVLKANQNDAAVVFQGIQRAVNAGLDPGVSKTQAAEYFGKTLFAPEGVNVLRGMQDPGRVFSMFVNPMMTEKLRGTTTWDEYRDFAMDQAAIVMKPVGDTIVDTQKYTYRGVVQYDEKSGKFGLDTQGVGADPIDFRQTQLGQRAVSQMNQYMDAMKPILDAEGITADQFLSGVLVGKEYKKAAKEGSWLQRMGTAVYDALQNASPANPQPKGRQPPSKTKIDLFENEDSSFQGSPHQSIEGHQRRTNVIKTRSPILNLIGAAEGADFNTMFGGGKHDLPNMTVKEVLQLQKQNVKSKGGSPAGAMQVTDDTLKDLIKAGVVKLSDKFDQVTQERIGHALLERRGYSKFISGEMSVEDFADSLAHEWASLPLANGLSAYKGIADNKARISRQQLLDVLERLKQ